MNEHELSNSLTEVCFFLKKKKKVTKRNLETSPSSPIENAW